MLSLSLTALFAQLIWSTAVMPASLPSVSLPMETLQFRITGESAIDSEICTGGRCMNVTHETWTFTVTPAGVTAESEIEHKGWDQNREGDPCSVGGEYRGRHEVTHLAWSAPPSERRRTSRLPSRMLHVRTRVSDHKGAETSGNCPEENYSHRVYEVLKDGLEQAALDEWFLPLEPGSRTTRSVPAEENETVYTLEVLQGDLSDLARYATLRGYITPLTAKP